VTNKLKKVVVKGEGQAQDCTDHWRSGDWAV